MIRSEETRAWLVRLLLSLLIALTAGALGYLVARALSSAYLLYQQQQFIQETTGVLGGGGIEALANSNLRALRQTVAALEAQYTRLSIQIGFACAALAAVISYIWLERHATPSTPRAARSPRRVG